MVRAWVVVGVLAHSTVRGSTILFLGSLLLVPEILFGLLVAFFNLL